MSQSIRLDRDHELSMMDRPVEAYCKKMGVQLTP